MKTCSKCGEVKPIDGFNLLKRSPDGRYPSCKTCENARKNAWVAKNRERVRAQKHRYVSDNLEKERARGRAKYHADPLKTERNRARYAANPEPKKAREKAYRVENWGRRREIETASNKRHWPKRLAGIRRRQAAQLKATPQWLTQAHLADMELLYLKAARLTRETGTPHHVDHIHPLRGAASCGLHVPWNLQVITADENWKKGNRIG